MARAAGGARLGAAIMAVWAMLFGLAAAQERDARLIRAMDGLFTPNLRPADRGAPTPLDTDAPNAIVIDISNGRVLGVKAAERAIPPASMTKMMTALLVFEALDRGALALDERVTVSARAASAPGSTMGLQAGDAPTVDELLQGLLVASGNDAAVALAERLAGSEAAFARAMTERARALGLETAVFRNATGLPAAGHRISVADLAALAAHIIDAHPDRRRYFRQQSVRWRGVRWWNRNPALDFDLSDLDARADGMKTGHTNAAGYCVTASATVRTPDGPRRVVIVLAGLPSESARAAEAERVLRWAAERVRED